MSDRLAVSASLSVLMMAIYVLFGTDSANAPFERDHFAPSPGAIAPAAAELVPSPWTLLR